MYYCTYRYCKMPTARMLGLDTFDPVCVCVHCPTLKRMRMQTSNTQHKNPALKRETRTQLLSIVCECGTFVHPHFARIRYLGSFLFSSSQGVSRRRASPRPPWPQPPPGSGSLRASIRRPVARRPPASTSRPACPWRSSPRQPPGSGRSTRPRHHHRPDRRIRVQTAR